MFQGDLYTMWLSDVVILGEDITTIYRYSPLASRHNRIRKVVYQVPGHFTQQMLIGQDTLVSSWSTKILRYGNLLSQGCPINNFIFHRTNSPPPLAA